jgi:hypothetical protein
MENFQEGLSLKQKWKISKYSYAEAFTQSQLDMAGSGQTKILEKMQRNTKYMKSQNLGMKFAMILYLGGLIFLPLITFNQIDKVSSTMNQEWVILIGSLSIGIYFALQTIYTIIFGIFFTSSLLSGEVFTWFRTLPLGKKDLQHIGFLTFLRGIDVEVIIIILALPVGILFSTNNLLLTLISLLLSFANVFFSVSLLLILGKKIHNVLQVKNSNSKKATFIRVMVLLSYVFMTSIIGIILQLSLQYLLEIFSDPLLTSEQISIVNLILPVIPFPFAQGYILISLYVDSSGFQNPALLMGFLGFLFFLTIIRKTFRKGNNLILESIQSRHEIFEGTQSIATLKDVSILILPPVNAFFKKDKKLATRDIQMMMLMVMPVMLPIIGVLTMGMTGLPDFEVIQMMLIINSLYLIMGGIMVSMGTISVETSGATILASLPVIIRDQAKAKMRWLFILVPLSGVIQIVFVIGNSYFTLITGAVLMITPFGIIIAIATLELKVFFFGKLKYKYVLEEVIIRRKILKWVGIFIFDIIAYSLLIIPLLIYLSPIHPVQRHEALQNMAMIYIPAMVICGTAIYYIFNRMFPKHLQSAE